MRGLRTGNDDGCDLFVLDRAGRISALFQILDEMALTALHAKAMQLLLKGLDLPGEPHLILLSPTAPEPSLQEKFKRLRIYLLGYDWREDRAVFPKLDSLWTQISS